jgi:hypothetical protein
MKCSYTVSHDGFNATKVPRGSKDGPGGFRELKLIHLYDILCTCSNLYLKICKTKLIKIKKQHFICMFEQ